MRYGMYGNTVLMSETTRFNILGDLLYLPRGIFFATALSAWGSYHSIGGSVVNS